MHKFDLGRQHSIYINTSCQLSDQMDAPQVMLQSHIKTNKRGLKHWMDSFRKQTVKVSSLLSAFYKLPEGTHEKERQKQPSCCCSGLFSIPTVGFQSVNYTTNVSYT